MRKPVRNLLLILAVLYLSFNGQNIFAGCGVPQPETASAETPVQNAPGK